MPPKRSAARGSSKKRKAPAPMEFQEGNGVLAKWPGTNLYFNAKVTYVRDDDEEYDVQYEDGTVFTIKAKDVRKVVELKKKTPSRSRSRGRSRGRSPGRRSNTKKAAPASTATPPSPPTKSVTRQSRSTARARAAGSNSAAAAATPLRHSARIAAKGELSDDERERKRAGGQRGKRRSLREYLSDLSFEWVSALVFAALVPFVLISLHTLCTAKSCKPALPFDKFPKTLKAYWDVYTLPFVVGFAAAGKIFHLLPVGAVVRAASGRDVRMNGFVNLLLMLAAVPVLVYKRIPLSFITDRYFHLMVSCFAYAAFVSVAARVKAHFFPEKRSNINPKGDTGNPIVDICNGRELNPFIAGSEAKLELFRFSMAGLAMLNVVMVIDSIMGKGGEVNPVVTLASSFQILYALDALFFEEYFFLSHDSMNSGFGFHLLISYLTFPFMPTLITKYLIDRNPTLEWYYLVAIAFLNAVGYILFRASETQRCEFAKDPNSPSVRHLETLIGAGGRKLLVSGWWSIVRHPNYLGEILMQWSWVLPAACTAGRTDLLVYYVPIMTTLVLVLRCLQENAKNKRRYGTAWNTYCTRVTGNLIPKVF